jgi:hypothetical protein
MGRIIREVEIADKKLRALFDSGSERSYIAQGSISESKHCESVLPFDVGLGSLRAHITKRCIVNVKIEDMGFDVSAHVIDDLGEIDGDALDLIIGATAMEEWDIKLTPKGKKLDLAGLKRRDFTEY